MNKFQETWKQLAANKALTSSDMAVLAISKAVHEEQRLKKADSNSTVDALELAKHYLKKNFKPITKPIKLENGAYPYGSLYVALWNLSGCESFKAFADFWSEEDRNKILEIAKTIKGNRYGTVNL